MIDVRGRQQLTSTDSLSGARSTSEVALQALCAITRQCLVAVFKELPRANSAASAAIQRETDSCCTPRGAGGTPAVLRAPG